MKHGSYLNHDGRVQVDGITVLPLFKHGEGSKSPMRKLRNLEKSYCNEISRVGWLTFEENFMTLIVHFGSSGARTRGLLRENPSSFWR
jgi:hypothetical protein